MHLKTKAHMVKSSPLLLLLLCHMLELVHVRHWHGLKACWLYNRRPAHDVSYGGGRSFSGSSVVCGDEYLGSEPQLLHYYRAIIIKHLQNEQKRRDAAAKKYRYKRSRDK